MALSGLHTGDPIQVGAYQLHARLGSGGMGAVYLGFAPSGAAVAVKTLPPGVDPNLHRRFRREAEMLAGLRHPRVAALVDADVSGAWPWLAMEYVPGPSLAEVAMPLPLGRLEQLASGLAEALAALHRAGVTHRDVKPSNVILTFDGPVLVDLGIAASAGVTALTTQGVVVGTPAWMAPEQLLGTEVGPPSDVWGWAALVCYAATGRLPFADGPLPAVAYRIQRAEPDLSGVPHGVHGLVAAALSKDPARRPTARQLADATTTPMASLWMDAPTMIADGYAGANALGVGAGIGAGGTATPMTLHLGASGHAASGLGASGHAAHLGPDGGAGGHLGAMGPDGHTRRALTGPVAPDGTLLAVLVRAVVSGLMRRGVAVALAVVALACVFGPLLVDRVADAVSRVDRTLPNRIATNRAPWLTSVARAIADVGNPVVVGVAAVIVAGLVCWRARRAWPGLATAAVLGGAVGTWAGTAALIGRPRPPAAMRLSGVSVHGSGYPSLSATVAAAGFGLIAALLCPRLRRLGHRVALGSAAVVAACAVGVTQLYLGTEWMSDVGVGWLLGVGWLAVVFALPRPRVRMRRQDDRRQHDQRQGNQRQDGRRGALRSADGPDLRGDVPAPGPFVLRRSGIAHPGRRGQGALPDR